MQIKVKDTRMHTIFPLPPQEYTTHMVARKRVTEVQVAEGKLVIIPIGHCHSDQAEAVLESKIQIDGTIYKPIIISETEKQEDLIPNENWLLFTPSLGEREIGLYTGSSYGLNYSKSNGETGTWSVSRCCKILVLPQQFSPKHLQAIVDGKMKDGDKVLVECEDLNKSWFEQGSTVFGNTFKHHDYQIKLTQGFVTLHKIVERMIPLSVAMEAAEIAYKAGYDGVDWIDGQFIKKWLEQNVT